MRYLVVLLLTVLCTTSCAFASEPDGLYIMARRQLRGPLEISSYYFKNGRVACNPISNLATFNFTPAEVRDPKWLGTYSVSGNQMTINWTNSSTRTAELKPKDHGAFEWYTGLFVVAKPFPSGTKLNGSYQGGVSGYGIANSRTVTFSPNGTYKIDSIANVQSYENGTKGDMITSGSGAESGTYQISGTNMTLSGGGKSRQVVAFPFDDRIFFDGVLMKPLKQ